MTTKQKLKKAKKQQLCIARLEYGLSKKAFEELERLFSAELNYAIGKESAVPRCALEDNGLAELFDRGYCEHTYIRATRVHEWRLTHGGRIAYCESCRDWPDDLDASTVTFDP